MSFHERAVGSPIGSESGLGAAKDLEREFARAFPSADFGGAKLNESLRHAIHRFVEEARARGTSENDVVVAMKDVARRAGFARPDTTRPLASLPADRLFTRAITACLEMYHEADDVPPPGVDPTIDAQLDLESFRALLVHNDEADFSRAVGRYVRSAQSRGLSVDHVLASVARIIKASDDATKHLGEDALRHGRDLVMRGLVLALYADGVSAGQAADAAPRTPSPIAFR
jgi:hypothetical protein